MRRWINEAQKPVSPITLGELRLICKNIAENIEMLGALDKGDEHAGNRLRTSIKADLDRIVECLVRSEVEVDRETVFESLLSRGFNLYPVFLSSCNETSRQNGKKSLVDLFRIV